MTEQFADANTPQATEETSLRSIWILNPAVPLTARILAYVFGILMLLTIVKSCTNERPPDVVEYPGKWSVYQDAQGLSIPYPDGWQWDDRSNKSYTDVVCSIPPDESVRMEFVMLKSPYAIDTTMLTEIRDEFERNLRKEYKAYTVQSDGQPDNGWQMFTARTTSLESHQRLVGAWGIRIQGNNLLFFIASSPSDGWSEMRRILSYVYTNTEVFGG